ncbi:MAG: phage tail protein [Lachnospiraceae bacterium]|nr:phage tail protein [Lachnospiraceae bacterium]
MGIYTAPVLNYRFQVLIENTELAFSKVSGISMNRELEVVSEGGNSGGRLALGKPKGIQTLRLEAGVYKSGPAILHRIRPGIYLPGGVVINVLDGGASIAVKYGTDAAYVAKWDVSELNARQGSVLINTFEIAYTQLSILK